MTMNESKRRVTGSDKVIKTRDIEVKVPTNLSWFEGGMSYNQEGYPRNYCCVASNDEISISVPEILVQVTKGHGTTMYHSKPVSLTPAHVTGTEPPGHDFAERCDLGPDWWGEMFYYHQMTGYGTKDCIQSFVARKHEYLAYRTDWRYGYIEAELLDVKVSEYGVVWLHICWWRYEKQWYESGYAERDPMQYLPASRPAEAWIDWNEWYPATKCSYAYDPPDTYSFVSQAWLFNEPAWFRNDPPGKGEFVLRLMREAAQQAADQFPTYADNNLANGLELGSLLFNACTGNIPGFAELVAELISARNFSEYAKLLGKLWLMYRYAYKTTKSDIEQAQEALRRRMLTYYTPTRFDGIASRTLGGTDIAVRVGFDVQLSLDPLKDWNMRFRNAGLDVSGYTIWDLIPFSFMVDWFLPVGDWLEDQRNEESLRNYVITNVCWSISYVRDVDKGSGKYYTRWYEPLPDVVYGGSYHLISGGTATWGMRAADVFSLCIQ